MKKKRGFTLIELLAVIIVLAIISVITIPLISGVIEKTRKGSVRASVFGMFDAADLYYARNSSEPLVDGKIQFTCNGIACTTPTNGK